MIITAMQFVSIFIASSNTTRQGEKAIQGNNRAIATELIPTICDPFPDMRLQTEHSVGTRATAEKCPTGINLKKGCEKGKIGNIKI